MTPQQCKMARAGLGWTVVQLAEAAKVSFDTVVKFENNDIEKMRDRTKEAISNALENAGVEFIPENGGGAGVRMRKD